MAQKKIPDWVAPVAGIGIAAGIVTAVVAYAASKGTFDETPSKDASSIDIAKLKAKKISTFIIEKNHIEDLTDTSFSMKHGGDYVVFACPYDYDSVKIYRSDIIDGKETRSTITLNKGESKKITLTEEGRNVDMFFTLAEPAAVDEDITWDPEARPHGTWWYLIGITAGGKYGYKTINPQGVESKFKGANSRVDAENKAKAEIEAAGGTAGTVVDVYTPPPLEQRLVSISDKTSSGYRIEVWSNSDPLPGEHPAYWRVTRPSGEVVGPNGADSIAQATDTANNLVRAELPATTETIMYKNYQIDLTSNPATTPSYYAKITYPNGQYVSNAVSANSRDECLTKAKAFIDPLADKAAKDQKRLDDGTRVSQETAAKGPIVYEYNRYTLVIKPHRLGMYGIIYNPSYKQIGQTEPYLKEADVRADANKKINAHWASLTAQQQYNEIVAYNKRKGITTPVTPPSDGGRQAAIDAQRANTRTAIINQLNSTGQSAYKNYKLVRDGNNVFVYSPTGAKVATFFSSNPTGENNINAAMIKVDEITGTSGVSGINGYKAVKYTGYKTGYDTPEVKIIAVNDKTNQPVLSMQKIFGGQYVLLKHSGKRWVPVGMFGSLEDLNIAADVILRQVNLQEVQNRYTDAERLVVESARAQRTGRSVVVRPGVVMRTAGKRR
jgi:hypothetical protein